MPIGERILLIVFATVTYVLLAVPSAKGAWPTDPAVNVGVCTEASDQSSVRIVSDNAGGAILAWMDLRSYQNPPPQGIGIFAQRIDANGTPLWTADGIAVCVAADSRQDMQIVADGSGGAILCWRDSRGGSGPDIYAQHIDATGSALWSANGIPVYSGTNYQALPQLVSDHSGGAIILWTDDRNGVFNFDLYAQRIDASGTMLWDAAGVPVCTAPNGQYAAQIVTDGSNGAIVVWADGRRESGPFAQDTLQVYAQRIDSGGNTAWTENGVAAAPDAPPFQTDPLAVPGGTGDVIVSWIDAELDPDTDIFAQRIDPSGTLQWGDGAAAICVQGMEQYAHRIASNGAGGAIISWADTRTSALGCDMYAQNIDASGTPLWTANGIPVICTPTFDQRVPQMISDGAGGAIFAWQDTRNGGVGDIYGQRIDPAGEPRWESDGQRISSATGDQLNVVLVSDLHFVSGALIAWMDKRSGLSTDIYAQHVNAHGRLGLPVAVTIQSFSGRASTGSVELQWNISTDETIAGFIISRSDGNGTPFRQLGEGAPMPPQATSYTDRTVQSGASYCYTLSVLKADGTRIESSPITVSIPAIGLSLDRIYPNPFNPVTTITYSVPDAGRINLSIFDTDGTRIATLVDGPQPPGTRSITWDGTNNLGVRIASGIYLVRLQSRGRFVTRKMVLVR